jgi:hypothetical protein
VKIEVFREDGAVCVGDPEGERIRIRPDQELLRCLSYGDIEPLELLLTNCVVDLTSRAGSRRHPAREEVLRLVIDVIETQR